MKELKKSNDLSDVIDSPTWKELHYKARTRDSFSVEPSISQVVECIGKQSVDEEVYDSLHSLMDTLIKEGGITDHDDNYDFEREPTAEELPK